MDNEQIKKELREAIERTEEVIKSLEESYEAHKKLVEELISSGVEIPSNVRYAIVDHELLHREFLSNVEEAVEYTQSLLGEE